MDNENKELKELLEQQLKAQKKLVTLNTILVVCMAVITLASVLLVVKLSSTLSGVDTVLAGLETTLESSEEIEELLPNLKEAADSIAAVSKSLEDEGLPKLYETLENLEGLKKLQDINIEELNGAITSLHDVVQPLANLFGR